MLTGFLLPQNDGQKEKNRPCRLRVDTTLKPPRLEDKGGAVVVPKLFSSSGERQPYLGKIFFLSQMIDKKIIDRDGLLGDLKIGPRDRNSCFPSGS
jgi:hypothetical protein